MALNKVSALAAAISRQMPRAGRQAMKRLTINRRNAPLAKTSIEELPRPADRPAERHAHRIIMNIGGKRFELTTRMEVREMKKGPAKVIQMPKHPADTLKGAGDTESPVP